LTITINQQNIHYIIAGEGETVLLLHGWGADGTLFQPLTRLLAKQYRVIALDFPGFGRSEEPKTAWSVDDYADCVLAFLRALDVQSCVLVGHSFGGRVIFKLTARQLPELKIPKIVLIDAAGIKPTPTERAIKRQKRYKRGKKLLELPLVRMIFPNALEHFRQKHGSADYNAASPRMREVLVKTVNEDLSHLLPLITPPTLLIWGRNDTATPLADAERMEREMPAAGLAVLENAGHFSFIDQQAQFLRIMQVFLMSEPTHNQSLNL
jgi:pimeloyl-ACP methyl ester carboxylesterase